MTELQQEVKTLQVLRNDGLATIKKLELKVAESDAVNRRLMDEAYHHQKRCQSVESELRSEEKEFYIVRTRLESTLKDLAAKSASLESQLQDATNEIKSLGLKVTSVEKTLSDAQHALNLSVLYQGGYFESLEEICFKVITDENGDKAETWKKDRDRKRDATIDGVTALRDGITLMITAVKNALARKDAAIEKLKASIEGKDNLIIGYQKNIERSTEAIRQLQAMEEQQRKEHADVLIRRDQKIKILEVETAELRCVIQGFQSMKPNPHSQSNQSPRRVDEHAENDPWKK